MLFDNVLALCKEKGITIARLEREAGLGNATVRGWENSTPNIVTIKKVADYFGVGIDDLLSQSGADRGQ